MKHSLLFLLVILSYSCTLVKEDKNIEIVSEVMEMSSVEVKYAKGFKMLNEGSVNKLQILNPFDDFKIENTYVFPNGDENYEAKENEVILKKPIQSIAALSTAFYSMIDELDKSESIVAIEKANFVFSQTILSGVVENKIDEVGGNGQLNLEKLIMLYPDLIMVGGYGGETSPEVLKLKDAGLIVFNNYDWKEKSPLGRAEWIKVFGFLYNESEKADSIFNQIEHNYQSYKAQLDTISTEPKVLFSSLYNGVWYIPGGNSYVAQFLKDAKGTYSWNEDTSTGSLPLSIESVANEMLDADVWISSNHYSLANLKEEDARYVKFKPFLDKTVFEYDRRATNMGGNDYWETGSLRVDIILKDYINMIHPGILENQELYFFRQLED